MVIDWFVFKRSKSWIDCNITFIWTLFCWHLFSFIGRLRKLSSLMVDWSTVFIRSSLIGRNFPSPFTDWFEILGLSFWLVDFVVMMATLQILLPVAGMIWISFTPRSNVTFSVMNQSIMLLRSPVRAIYCKLIALIWETCRIPYTNYNLS